jgi:hypothetical protein
MGNLTDRPELVMVRKALVPAAVALALVVAVGFLFGGPGAAASAGIGIAIVYVNFTAHGYSLAWASTVSVGTVMGVALGGFAIRLGIIVGAMFALNTLSWFSPAAFGLAVFPATLLLLGYEAQLASRGIGASLQIPADEAATRAGASMAAREAS